MTESGKRIAPFGLRLTPDLKDRVIEAAAQSKTSVNSLIAAILEREFPQPTINLHEMAAFLDGLAEVFDEQGSDSKYVQDVNRSLGSAKTPWCVKYDGMGVLSFYPFIDRGLRDEVIVEKGLDSEAE